MANPANWFTQHLFGNSFCVTSCYYNSRKWGKLWIFPRIFCGWHTHYLQSVEKHYWKAEVTQMTRWRKTQHKVVVTLHKTGSSGVLSSSGQLWWRFWHHRWQELGISGNTISSRWLSIVVGCFHLLCSSCVAWKQVPWPSFKFNKLINAL